MPHPIVFQRDAKNALCRFAEALHAGLNQVSHHRVHYHSERAVVVVIVVVVVVITITMSWLVLSVSLPASSPGAVRVFGWRAAEQRDGLFWGVRH